MLRRVLVAMTCAACLTATAAAAPRTPAVPKPLLGVAGSALTQLDPSTLLRVPRARQLPLPLNMYAYAFSPDRSQLVLGANDTGKLVFVDVRRMRQLGVLRIGTDAPVKIEWVDGRWFVVSAGFGVVRVQIVDPARRRVVATRELDGNLLDAGATADRLVLALAPAGVVGTARVAVVDVRGDVAAASLDRIAAGFDGPSEEPAQPPKVLRIASPGLAVDPAGRVFVVGGGAPIAEIDVRTLAVTYHELGSAGGDRAEKGGLDGPARRAWWLGPDTLAVSGSDQHGWIDSKGVPQQRSTPFGLWLVDTRTWTARLIEPRATSLAVGDGALLATASLWDSAAGTVAGIGLVAHAPDGETRFHLFGDRAVDPVVLGKRAFVLDAPSRYSVVDLSSGQVVRQIRAPFPYVLVD